MAIIDIIILIPVCFGAFQGFRKGLLMEIITLVAFILATVLSFKLLHQAMELLSPYIGKNTNVLPVLSFILVFVLVIYLIHIIGKALKGILDVTLLGTVDNLAGAFVGALKWAFGFSVLLWLMDSATIGLPEDFIDGSIVYPYFVAYGPLLIEWFSILIPYAKELVNAIKEIVNIKST